MVVSTTLGEMDDSALQRYDYTLEDGDKRVTAVEYCLAGCTDEAHQQRPRICPNHVHRSVAVTVKRFPEGECVGFTATLA